MLYPANDYLLYVIKQETARRYRREVTNDHLPSEIDLPKPNRFASLARKALHDLGHLLVALGQRLDRAVEPGTA